MTFRITSFLDIAHRKFLFSDISVVQVLISSGIFHSQHEDLFSFSSIIALK
jgi:hypothetical protein